MPGILRSMLDLSPKKIYGKTLKFQNLYKAERKKPTARVALLIGCVQRVVSPQINESTIRILTRHGVEVMTMPEKNQNLKPKELQHSIKHIYLSILNIDYK